MSGPTDPAGSSEADPRIGSVLSERYRIDALLGEGGMGKVYAAEHVLMRKKLAIKILHRELTSVPEVVQRFEREAMAAANIEHANVAAATDFGKLEDGSVYLVLEFVSGRNLRDEIAEGPLSFERALHVTRQIASALASAHELQIVHRDLKPENVMLVDKAGDADFVKVLDFGIARVPIGDRLGEGQAITKVGMVFGTPEYMAPEQALGQPVDGRADLYALGVILFEMITGVRPFSSKSAVGVLGQQLSKPPPTFAERAPGLLVPPAIEQFTHRLLAKESSERFQTAKEVASQAAGLLGAGSVRGVHVFTRAVGTPAVAPPPPASIPDLEAPLEPEAPLLVVSQPEPRPVSLPESAPEWEVSDEALSGPGHTLVGHAPPPPAALPEGPPSAQAGPVASALEAAKARGQEPLEQYWERLLDGIDALRGKLPPNARRALENVPTVAFLVALLVIVSGAVLGVVLLIVALARPSKPAPVASSSATPTAPAPDASETAPPVDPDHAPADALSTAKSEGATALVTLSEKYPKDARVLLALAGAQVAQKSHLEALTTVERVLVVNPALNDSPELASVLWDLAQRKDSQEGTFRLLQGPMGSRGADIVYDLSVKGNAVAKARAQKWLGTTEFARASSPALNVLVALTEARSCSQSHGLLLRAKNVGDHRVLALLEGWKTKQTGCGRATVDCACLAADDRLDSALAELRKRLQPKAP